MYPVISAAKVLALRLSASPNSFNSRTINVFLLSRSTPSKGQTVFTILPRRYFRPTKIVLSISTLMPGSPITVWWFSVQNWLTSEQTKKRKKKEKMKANLRRFYSRIQDSRLLICATMLCRGSGSENAKLLEAEDGRLAEKCP